MDTETIQYTYALKYRNAFGMRRLVVVATDIHAAIAAADQYIAAQTKTEYEYRLIGAEVVEGTVLHVDGEEIRAGTK